MRQPEWSGVVVCFALLLLAILAGRVEAMTGNQYQTFSAPARITYVDGVMGAWILANHFMSRNGDPDLRWEAMFERVVRCVDERMTVNQIIAITEKYMKEHPAEWRKDMTGLVWVALLGVCPVSLPDTLDPRGPKGK